MTAARKRVLVVDDEKALLPLLERYLRKLGYDPACYTDPDSALAAYRAAEQPFALVMTDLTLEGVSGEELAKSVLAADTAVCVVVMSGYPYSTENFAAEDQGRVAFLQKPFLPRQFQEVVDRFVVAPVLVEPVPVVPVPVETAVPLEAAVQLEPVPVPAEPVKAPPDQPRPGSETIASAD